MSEDSVSIMCMVDKRSPKKIQTIEENVKSFCREINHTDCEKYYEGKYLIHELSFFNGDFDDIGELLRKLSPHSKSAPIAKIYLDTVGEVIYSCLIKDQIQEFENLKEAHYAWEESTNIESVEISNLPYRKGRTSLVRLRLRKAKKEKILKFLQLFITNDAPVGQNIIDLIISISNKIYEPEEGFRINSNDILWNGQLERILPYLTFVLEKGSDVIIGFDLYDIDLFANYPTPDEVKTEIDENLKINENMGCSLMKTKEVPVIQDLRLKSLIDAVECMTSWLVNIDGVSHGHARLRHIHLPTDEEIQSSGSSNDGAYYCSDEELSDDELWLN
jgi:hypothetical protein